MRNGAARVKKGGNKRKPEPLDPPTAKLETRLELIASILESFLLGPGVSAQEPLNGALGLFSKVWVALGCARMSQKAEARCGGMRSSTSAGVCHQLGQLDISVGATGVPTSSVDNVP